jgi:hypothetical protein
VFHRVLAVLTIIALAGCTTAPTAPSYTGPVATVVDRSFRETAHRVQYFYVAEIDGARAPNAMRTMRQQNYGRGFNSMATGFSRDIPVRPTTLRLEGRIAYGAPIQEIVMMATMYEADTYIEFTPEPSESYHVVGELTAEKKVVWLQKPNGERVGKVIAPPTKRHEERR